MEDILHVYLAEIYEELNIEGVYPTERRNEILSCKSDKVKREKYSAWKLLELAVKKSFGLDFNTLKFKKNESGKWLCDRFYFSLSHSKNAVAVALSTSPVGVDIEIIKEPKNWSVANKILSDFQLEKLNGLFGVNKVEYFILKWTEKESAYKMQNDIPILKINTDTDCGCEFLSKRLEFKNQPYVFTVAGKKVGNLQYFVEYLNDIQ
ncbi:MAG: 4'-phosphopantetheinyl transferase superfamily protein [Clostridiales bacterium]|nr:4'-phosphopantetheinyl transferase superfamily protein [Clostridiales bacterium]